MLCASLYPTGNTYCLVKVLNLWDVTRNSNLMTLFDLLALKKRDVPSESWVINWEPTPFVPTVYLLRKIRSSIQG